MILGVLSMVHTTARVDRKEVNKKERAMQKQAEKVAWQLLYGDHAFPMAGSSIMPNLAQQLLCPHKSTSYPVVASGSPFEVCPNPDATHCAEESSQCPPRHVKMMCTHHSDVLRKQYAHGGEGTSKM